METAGRGGHTETFLRLVRLRNVRLLLFGGLVTLLVEHGFTNWLPRMLETRNYSPEAAGFIASIPLIVALPTVLVTPRLVPVRWRGRGLAAISLLAAVSMLVVYIPDHAAVISALVLYGLTAPSVLDRKSVVY
jgi:cyanate permease